MIGECIPVCVAYTADNSASFNLSALNGTDGFVVQDIINGESSGWSISSGDINNDHIDDLLIGAPSASPGNRTNAGTGYVVFGQNNSAFNVSFNILSELNGKNGFVINGKNIGDNLGISIASGDINGDGIDDVLIGAYHASPARAGATYVVFGQNSSNNITFNASFDVSELNGTNGFAINGANMNDNSGIAIASGDINGDGIDDVIIGAWTASPGHRKHAGATYVVFGHNNTGNASIELANLNGTNGFALFGVSEQDNTGCSVASGDINGDSIDDVLIGAFQASPGGKSQAGTSYVVFGRKSTFSASFELSEINGENGLAINGANIGDISGNSIASGDINDDGFADILIGAPGNSPGQRNGAGASYIIFGQNNAFTASLDLELLNDKIGFAINGANAGDNSGSTVASGDINGDGIDDVLIGATFASPNDRNKAGTSYVIFGHSNFRGSFDLSELNGKNGFALNGVNGNDNSGQAIATGDVNGDHVDDIIIGAPGTDGNPLGSGNASFSYVVFVKYLPNLVTGNHKPVNWGLILGIVGGVVAGLCLLAGTLYIYYRKQQKQDKELNDFASETDPLLAEHKLLFIPVGTFHIFRKITKTQAEELHKQAGIKVPFREGATVAEVRLGKGQYGEVLVAQQRKTKEYLACKVICGEEAIRTSKYEAKLQQKLKNKPHIMPLIDSIETKDENHNPVLYQFLPLAGFGNGKTLKKALTQLTDRKMKDKIIVHVAKSLLVALHGAHELKLYHLDVKPKNVVIDQKGQIYLIDFGCMVEASLSDASIMPVYNDAGRPISGGGDTRYFSPERLEAINTNKPFDGERADAWALGVTLLELATNSNPFNHETLQDLLQVRSILTNIFQMKDTRPTSYWSVIKGLLEQNPEERLSITEVLEMPIFKRKNADVTFSSKQEQEGVFNLLQDLMSAKPTQQGQFTLDIQETETSTHTSNINSVPQQFLKPDRESHYGI